ncbi:MAG: MurR/RpiR family transcriptional regulator [Oscillospiraceae bacterium]|nr:MurR/RpiR family transcriptional regulator [Oscillospiraceae bacterium]
MIISPKCISELRINYSHFSPKERMVADYIISHPEDVLTCSIQQLAKKIGVSQYSILNCVREIGYHGYSDFRMTLAVGTQQMPFSGENEKEDASEDALDDETENRRLFRQVFEQNARCIFDTSYLIKPEDFNEVIDRIFLAKRTSIYGVGTSGYAANYLCIQLIRLGMHAVSVTEAEYQLLDAATLINADLLLGFSSSGNAQTIVEAFKFAKQRGCYTVAITASASSPLSQAADLTLLTTCSGPPNHARDTNNSIIEQISVATAISTAVCDELERGRKRTV